MDLNFIHERLLRRGVQVNWDRRGLTVRFDSGGPDVRVVTANRGLVMTLIDCPIPVEVSNAHGWQERLARALDLLLDAKGIGGRNVLANAFD